MISLDMSCLPYLFTSKEASIEALLKLCSNVQDRTKANRIFYLSIPPSIFTAVAGCASKAASSPSGWTRVIVEKPFGKDSESFAQLERELSNFLTEDQMYRIDHYLGKELIENLTVGSPSRHHPWPLTAVTETPHHPP